MFKTLKNSYYSFGAALTTGLLGSTPAFATGAGGNTFSDIAKNINTSLSNLPALIASLCYLFGLLLACLGIMKIKDHVENPTQTPLKDGAIRLLAGGCLFALPIITEAMLNTAGTGTAAKVAKLNAASWEVGTTTSGGS